MKAEKTEENKKQAAKIKYYSFHEETKTNKTPTIDNNKLDKSEKSMVSSKLRNYSQIEKKRIENHEKFNKEISQANYVLEQLLETCNKMLSQSQVIDNNNTANSLETNGKEKNESKTVSPDTYKVGKNDRNNQETNYEEDFEYCSAEFQGNIIVNFEKFSY